MKKFLAVLLSVLMVASIFAIPVSALTWKDGQTQATKDDGTPGNWTFSNAYGYVFRIDDINGKIGGEDSTIITNAEAYAACNPNWAINVLLAPVEGDVYEVVTVIAGPGSAQGGIDKGINFDDGKVVMIVHSSASYDCGFANWEQKVAAMALKAGDKITFSGIDLEAGTCVDGKATVQDDPADAEEPGVANVTVVPAYNFKYAAGATVLVPWTMGATLESILDKQYEWFNFAVLAWNAEAYVYEVTDVKIGTDIKATADPEKGVDFGPLEIPENGFILGAHADAVEAHDAIASLKVGDVVYVYGTGLDNATIETALTDAVVTTVIDESRVVFVPGATEEPAPEPVPNENIAFGKPYAYPTDGLYFHWSDEWPCTDNVATALTDGETVAGYYGMGTTSGWGGGSPNPLAIVIDLEGTYSISSFAYTLCGGTDGISMPAGVAIYVSDDGETFTQVNVAIVDGADDKVLDWTDCVDRTSVATAEAAVEGRYVKFEFTKNGNFVFINELEVYGVAAAGTDPEPTPDPEPVEGETFWVTHYNNNTVEGSGVIFTDAYDGAVWWIHVAFAPVAGYDDVYEIVGISDGTDAGDGVAQEIPEGGFVWASNYGNDYISLGWGDVDYTNDGVTAAIALAQTWAVGDQFVINGVDFVTVPTTTPEINWYDDGYVCTATIAPFFGGGSGGDIEVIPEEIITDGIIDENGWNEEGWTEVTPENGYWQSIPTTDTISYKYQFRTDEQKLYAAFIVDCVALAGGNGNGTNVRFWINTNPDATVYTHFYDVFVGGTGAKYNTSTTSNAGAAIENSSFYGVMTCDGEKTYVEFSVDLAEFNGENGFNYYICVSNKINENVCLYYPAVAENAEGNRTANLPYGNWYRDNQGYVDVEAIRLGEIIIDGGDEPTPGPSGPTYDEEMQAMLGDANADAKFDLIIDAPADYKAGDEITVNVTLKSEVPLHVLQYNLWYDNSKLLLTNKLLADEYYALDCVTLPEGWENWTKTANNYYDVAEGEEVVILNDGLIKSTILTSGTNEGDAITEITFTYTFIALEDASGEIGLVIAHDTVDGGYNTDAGADRYEGNGSYAVIYEDTTPSLEDQLKEQLGEADPDAKFEIIVDAPETYVPGEEITVNVTLKSEIPLHVLQFMLDFDNEKLQLLNTILDDNAVDCVTLPEGWENWTVVEYCGDLSVRIFTVGVSEEEAINEITFTFTFLVNEDVTGDIGFLVSNYDIVLGAYNTEDGADRYFGNGSYDIVAEGEAADYVLGDVDGDTDVDQYDYILLKRAVMGTYDLDDAQLLAANVNGDNVVDQYDYMLVKRAVMGTYTIG